jgi:site-specific DNA recombinase
MNWGYFAYLLYLHSIKNLAIFQARCFKGDYTMPEPTIVDIYCRTATSSPDDNTRLEEQERICREYCAAQGLTVGLVSYESFSGIQLHERAMLNRMRHRYKEGTIQGVVITNLDRLTRSFVHLAILMEEMEEHNVTLHIVEDRLAETARGKFIHAMSAFLKEVKQEKAQDL